MRDEREKEVLIEYGRKLKQIKNDVKFIKNMLLTCTMDEAYHMINYIDSHPGCTQRDVMTEELMYSLKKE